jgi:SAM-dependent methyltransferase
MEYEQIVNHYEACFEKHGDTPQGVDWPNLPDLLKRYRVMLDVVRGEDLSVSLLDFGCGTAMLKEFVQNQGLAGKIRYTGLDLGAAFIRRCRAKYPDTEFHHVDVLRHPEALPTFDYVVMNGVFTEKRDLPFEDMFDYFQRVLRTVFSKCTRGIAFNVMSKAVDWERDDLFHVPADRLIGFLTKELSRHFVLRNDYGLYEYTTYVYRTSI